MLNSAQVAVPGWPDPAARGATTVKSEGADAVPTPLDELSTAQINAIQTHSLHQQGFHTIITLIRQLRACESQADLYDFQQLLLDELLTIEEHRLKCSRVVKRLERGRSVPADAVALVGTGDPQQLATWHLEHDVCVRVSRQLRCVGDALAWRAFDYQRNFVLVLSRNQPPGPMAGKAGLLAERAFLTRTWRDDGHFAIMHDLTSCLRIGDASVFMPGFVRLEEIKTNNEHRTTAQKHRIRTAGEALRNAAPMPTGQVLVKIDVPYRTHLDVLREVLDLAYQRGLRRAQVPGGRALVAGNLFTAPDLWSEEEFGRRFTAAMQTAKRQARIVHGHEITLKSLWAVSTRGRVRIGGVRSRRRRPLSGAGEPVLKSGRGGCSAPWTVALEHVEQTRWFSWQSPCERTPSCRRRRLEEARDAKAD